MGQQQLLLIVLSVIIVGIAVAVGITMFGEQSASANLDAVVSDLQNMAARAQQYYVKPTGMGGGGRVYTNITLSDVTTNPTNDNGTYTIPTTAAQSIVLLGIGVEDGDGEDGGGTTSVNVEVQMTVYAADSTTVAILDR